MLKGYAIICIMTHPRFTFVMENIFPHVSKEKILITIQGSHL